MTGPGRPLVDERKGDLLTLRLNRPDAGNALTPELMAAIGAALAQAETDPGVRAVVLTGTGDRAFCSGMDLKAFGSGQLDAAAMQADGMDGFHRLLRGETTVPVVGAANATAVAGGLELLLGCDVIVASATARFGLPEVKRGLFAGSATASLSTRIPLAVALELTLTGDPIGADRALALGLVNRVVAPEQVAGEARALAERIAANGPLALQATKELVRLAATDAPEAARRLPDWQQRVFTSDDAREGAAAFVEKRDPVWEGR